MSTEPVRESPDVYDVAIVGAGPAGLSAALNLVRARRHTIVIDGNRPRNAATFHSHGFITRDGVSPLELRKLARQELQEYPHYEYHQAMVTAITRVDGGFSVASKAGLQKSEYTARTVVIATGVTEVMPALPTLRAFYGTSIHSCIECDGYEERGGHLAMIGETDDLADRAMLLSQWSSDIIVFTNGVGTVTDMDEAVLADRGITVDRRALDDVVGDQTGLTGIRIATGEVVPRSAAFVRPIYEPALAYVDSLGLATGIDGHLVVDAEGRTSLPGVYAAGDSAEPGPRQLIVAAGQGARVASALNGDLARAVFANPAAPAYAGAPSAAPVDSLPATVEPALARDRH
ncbi:NAD(P)/FAD-dependent oxidoreductase [Marisediminicola senii]|uniref:NAD(P)/FAD-dependent oxidoreductase n=1 Tax=Marisediminicola senii TaxID=2711233 RepID=UPI0013EB6B56|nr:NAD(P)/FAD-dependent oxidoreductase [Marisediminicola senii]